MRLITVSRRADAQQPQVTHACGGYKRDICVHVTTRERPNSILNRISSPKHARGFGKQRDWFVVGVPHDTQRGSLGPAGVPRCSSKVPQFPFIYVYVYIYECVHLCSHCAHKMLVMILTRDLANLGKSVTS